MGNGDAASGDGYTYRGGGYLQLTGKESYAAYAKYIGKDIHETSELVHTTEHYALDSAAWEFVIDKKLLDECDRNEFITITKRINGGTIGLEDRKAHYNKFKELLG
jgi:putative chitinase